jgi:hypothetical protein
MKAFKCYKNGFPAKELHATHEDADAWVARWKEQVHTLVRPDQHPEIGEVLEGWTIEEVDFPDADESSGTVPTASDSVSEFDPSSSAEPEPLP